MDSEELTYTSADGETYVVRQDDEGHVELAVLSAGAEKHELTSILFFPDEVDDIAELLKRAAK